MPQTRNEKILFSLLMAIFMVYGMETYNHLLISNSFSFSVFLINPIELLYLVIIVIVLETFIGGPLARKIAFRIYSTPKSQLSAIIVTQICTVLLMCPMMSLVATILFKTGLSASIFSVWIDTFCINIIMALLWQLFIAGPLVRKIVFSKY